MGYHMIINIFSILIYYLIHVKQSNALFNIQDSLTILCSQFPLNSSVNDTSLQCARLRSDRNIPSSQFNLNNPSQISLFIIIDQLSNSNISPVNIHINFTQSANIASSVNEIYISLLVTRTNFTINNQTTSIYSSFEIPILYWTNVQSNRYDVIDLVDLDQNEYENDQSLCKWGNDRWDRLFNTTSSYVYILKTTNTDLIFTLVDPNTSILLPPYLNILYCIPYKFDRIELILSIIAGILFILFLVIVGILHCLKDERKLSQYFRVNFEDSNPAYTNPKIDSITNDEEIDGN